MRPLSRTVPRPLDHIALASVVGALLTPAVAVLVMAVAHAGGL